MRRSIKIAAVVAAGALTLTACSGGGGGGSGDDLEGRGDITIWYSNNEGEIEWGKQMVEAWNADHPDEQVKAQEIPAGDSSEAVIGAAITAGNAPCLIFNTSPAAVPQFEKAGRARVAVELPGRRRLHRTHAAATTPTQYASPDGEFYQMPWKSNPVVIFYNKAMFTAGRARPRGARLSTYDEFLDTSRTLVRVGRRAVRDLPLAGQPVLPVLVRLLPAVRGRDAAARSSSRTARRPSTPKPGQRSPSSGRPCTRRGWPDRRVQRRLVRRRQLGDDDRRALGHRLLRRRRRLGRRAGSRPPRARRPSETYTFSDAKNVGLFTACESKGTAWDVLKFATSEEQDGQLLELTGQMPMRQDLPDARIRTSSPRTPRTRSSETRPNRVVEVPNVAELDRGVADLPRRVLQGRHLRRGRDRRVPHRHAGQGRRPRRPGLTDGHDHGLRDPAEGHGVGPVGRAARAFGPAPAPHPRRQSARAALRARRI